MCSTPHSLSAQFDVPGLSFAVDNGGLTKAIVKTAVATGEMYLQGAHVTAWQPSGAQPVLWLSGSSYFAKGKPIRGGVPICFPWFGPHASDSAAPAHGTARIVEWELFHAQETFDGGVELTLQTRIEPFAVSFRVAFGQALTMTLTTALPVTTTQAQRFEDALHTYLTVSDVRNVSISGLESARYVDKMENATEKPATGEAITFTSETDRVYLQTESACELSDENAGRRLIVSKTGSRSTVVWNPWISKSSRMPDFGDHEWPGMVCIETANVGRDSIELLPGQSHATTAVISVR
jgi:glucose-6-phosphate 1-epimerase